MRKKTPRTLINRLSYLAVQGNTRQVLPVKDIQERIKIASWLSSEKDGSVATGFDMKQITLTYLNTKIWRWEDAINVRG